MINNFQLKKNEKQICINNKEFERYGENNSKEMKIFQEQPILQNIGSNINFCRIDNIFTKKMKSDNTLISMKNIENIIDAFESNKNFYCDKKQNKKKLNYSNTLTHKMKYNIDLISLLQSKNLKEEKKDQKSFFNFCENFTKFENEKKSNNINNFKNISNKKASKLNMIIEEKPEEKNRDIIEKESFSNNCEKIYNQFSSNIFNKISNNKDSNNYDKKDSFSEVSDINESDKEDSNYVNNSLDDKDNKNRTNIYIPNNPEKLNVFNLIEETNQTLKLELEEKDKESYNYLRNDDQLPQQSKSKKSTINIINSNNFLSDFNEELFNDFKFKNNYFDINENVLNSQKKNNKIIRNKGIEFRSDSIVNNCLNSLKIFKESHSKTINFKEKENYQSKNFTQTKKIFIRQASLEDENKSSSDSSYKYSEDEKKLKGNYVQIKYCTDKTNLSFKKRKYGKYNYSKSDNEVNFFDDFYLDFISKNKNNSFERITHDNYIERIELKNIINKRKKLNQNNQNNINNNSENEDVENEILFNLNIGEFIRKRSLKCGDMFGEIALKEHISKRTATIFASSNCHFGWSNKEKYDAFLSEHKTKNILNEVMNLLNCPVFRNYNKITFFREIYFTLNKRFVSRNELIFREGEVLKNIIFLNEGEYVLRVKKNIFEINNLIKKLGGISLNEYKEIEDDGGK